jgi:ADP-ribose pyrophosphatase YjhB (NUDIX family)
VDTLLTIRDVDLGLSTPVPPAYTERRASRAVVFDPDGKVALFHATIKGYHKLPGGGIELGETVEDALRREVLEEIGCAITDIKELGIIEEYRNALGVHQFSCCFTARLDGEKGTPHLEEGEIAEGFETVWLPLSDAVKTLAAETNIEDYQGKFIHQRDWVFLKKAAGLA